MGVSRDTLLDITDLTVEFNTNATPFRAVDSVNISIHEGDAVALVGESGSGKSVLARAIMNLNNCPPCQIRRGDIRFRDQSLLSMPGRLRRQVYGKEIGIVFQDPFVHLNPVYPIGWQIAEVCRIHGMTRVESDLRTKLLLDRVGIPNSAQRMRSYPHEFSGGQRQRIMICMAMAMAPKLLIADEPTTALDPTIQLQILELLKEFREESAMALLMITHDLGVASHVANDLLVMKDGKIVERGALVDIFSSPKHEYTAELVMDRSSQFRTKPPSDSNEILSVHNLSLCYGSYRALDGINFSLNQGEILGVVGESGSGKSSLAGTILRLNSPNSGSLMYDGHNVTSISGFDAKTYTLGVQAVFQDPYSSLNPRQSILEVLSEPWKIHPNFLAPDLRCERAAELLTMVGLTKEDLEKFPGEFSGGQLQRIAIARALALEPKILVCDEAVSALDRTIQAQIIRLLSELRTRLGLAIIFISHDLGMIKNFSDSVIVMREGRIVEKGKTENVLNVPRDAYTMELIRSSFSVNGGFADGAR